MSLDAIQVDEPKKHIDWLDSSSVDATSVSDDTMSALRSAFSSISNDVDIQILETVVESLRSFAAVGRHSLHETERS